MNKQLHQCEHILRTVGLEGPCYLLTSDELRHEFEVHGVPCGPSAFTGRLLDIQLSRQLQQEGRWQGRGFASVFFPERIVGLQGWIGIALHEFAHYLDFGTPAAMDDELLSGVSVLLGKQWPVDMEQRKTPSPLPWAGHGLRFVRACCHLAHRVGDIMESVRPSHLAFSQRYYGVSENTWMRLLDDELQDDRPISEILDTEAPQRFYDAWRYCTDE
jgi:hypothetical protein